MRHEHVGPCTIGPTYHRHEAVAWLHAHGYRFDEERGDWFRWLLGVGSDGLPVDRGRLAWRPDYCHPDQPSVGTRFFLIRPHGGGELTILGE